MEETFLQITFCPKLFVFIKYKACPFYSNTMACKTLIINLNISSRNLSFFCGYSVVSVANIWIILKKIKHFSLFSAFRIEFRYYVRYVVRYIYEQIFKVKVDIDSCQSVGVVKILTAWYKSDLNSFERKIIDSCL